ncbi:hypothetical protein [Streptomyces sp. NPDC051014]|uniref:hypothetical protein n=1 Tax=Streptomyces sp. NPDC051014 TaxID=3155751 RepID=UPI003400F5A1
MSYDPVAYMTATQARDAARTVRAIYTALRNEGFDQREAFTLTRDMLKGATK